MYYGSKNELLLLDELRNEKDDAATIKAELEKLLHQNHNVHIELSIDYMEAGMYNEAISILEQYLSLIQDPIQIYPLVYYYIGYSYGLLGDEKRALKHLELAVAANSDYCFPHRLEDILVLHMQFHQINPTVRETTTLVICGMTKSNILRQFTSGKPLARFMINFRYYSGIDKYILLIKRYFLSINLTMNVTVNAFIVS